ncbi:MAG TPA: heavy metal-associated domain-containing protein [Acetobacteraceae bacterium]|nr:heavy metal-associated domain-containing protein [Acetobacteraceae bacterium]
MSPPTQHLAVTGMTCTGCVKAVTRVLSRVTGVADVHVVLETGRADIVGTVRPADLIAAVRKAGYAAEVLRA